MNRTGIEPGVGFRTAVQTALAQDVTVVMPFYDRTKYFSHYVKEGFWDGFRLQIVCDGSPKNIVNYLKNVTGDSLAVNIHSYPTNKGVAFARKTGIELVSTRYLTFVDDDDIVINGHRFLERALKAMGEEEDMLFYTMQDVIAFTEELNFYRQYNRQIFNKRTARDLLTYMVFNGEISLLSLGSVFRSEDLQGIGPDTFFKVSEDYVFLARLCARYPHKRISVDTSNGSYLRLTQHESLSARNSYSIEKIVMNYISMFVGAHYLIKMGGLTRNAFQQILVKRGKILNASYKRGEETGVLMARLMDGGDMNRLAETNLSDEQRTAYNFLKVNEKHLPAEFYRLIRKEVYA